MTGEQNKRNWHNLTNFELEKAFNADTATGLSDAEANKRLRRGHNRVWSVETTSIRKYAAKSFIDLTTLLLAISVIVAAFFGGTSSAISVLLILLVTRFIRICVYVFSRNKLEKNARAALPRAKVVRSGNVKVIPADCIVTGDVIILDAGDTVPCDIRLTAADNVSVAESNITDVKGIARKDSSPIAGENIPIGLRSNMLYASSVIVDGFCMGIAVATGGNTLVVSRDGPIELSDSDDVPLFNKLSELGRYTELGLIGIALIVSVLGIAVGSKDLVTVFMPAVAMAAACLGEFITAIGFLTYANAFGKKGNNTEGVLRSSADAEKLSEADTWVFRNASLLKGGKITLHSYYADENFTLMGTKGAKPSLDLLGLACLSTGVTPSGSITDGSFGQQRVRQTSPIAYNVIHSLCEEHKELKKKFSGYSIIEHITAGEENSDNFDGTIVGKENRFFFVMSGKLERVIDRCSCQKKNGGIADFDDEDRKKLISYADALRKRGVGVVAIATRESPYNNMNRLSVLETNMCFEGFIAVSDRVDPESLKMIKNFRKDGGCVVFFDDSIIPEDSDRFFLESEGIFKTGDVEAKADDRTVPFNDGGLVLISTHRGMDGLRERIKFLNSIKEHKRNAIYIGGGVEDMWCIQNSYASIAAGLNIPQALRGISSGIVESSAPGKNALDIIKTSRKALVNIKNVLTYLMSSQIARIVLLLVTAVAAFPLPEVHQMAFWGLLFDFAVSMAIAFSPQVEVSSHKEYAYPKSIMDMIYPLLYGTLVSATSIASPYIGRAILTASNREFTLNDAQMMECMFVGSIISLLIIALEYAGQKGLFSRESRYSLMFICPAIVAILGIIITIAVSSSFPGWIMLAFSLIPSVVVIIVMALVRVLIIQTSKNDNK